MKIIARSDAYTGVTLSVRNLIDLLAEAQRTGGRAALIRSTSFGLLSINVEPDSVHYADRTPGPGTGALA